MFLKQLSQKVKIRRCFPESLFYMPQFTDSDICFIKGIFILYLDQSGPPRNNRSRIQRLGYKKLLEWSVYSDSDCDNLLLDLIAWKNALQTLLANDSVKEDWILLLLKVFRKVTLTRPSQNKIATLALLRGSSFLTKHVQNNLMVWSFSKTNEENVEIAECLKDIMLEFWNVFPSSHKELPLDTFKTFLIDCGETKFDKEVCCQYCFLRR